MKIPLSAALATISAICVLTAADVTNSGVLDDSMAGVLKTDMVALAEHLGDTSEAGQNHAARLLAAACRIKTEARVSTKSMTRVVVLAGWREALNRWDDLELEIVLLQSGGGTMWTHMMQRNDAQTEEFLDGIADHLPLEEAELQPGKARAIDELLKGAKNRLAQAKTDAAKAGLKPGHHASGLARSLEEAHAQLKWQFRYAGDEATTERLLVWCKETAGAWEAMNKPEKP